MINPQYVEQLASEAFWSFVFKNGWKATGYPEDIKDIPKTLWSQEILINMLISRENVSQEDLSEDLINNLYYAVAETIVDHTRKGENIIGTIFQEDFKSCKEPDFPFSDMVRSQFSDSDREAKYKLKLKGNHVNRGDLFLRTPYPSGVLLKSKPDNYQILTPSTSKAFGFEKKLVLPINKLITLPDNEYGYKYFATGVFHIPTTSNNDALWLKLIPNATAILKGFNLQCANGTSCTGEIIAKSDSCKKSFFEKIISWFQ